MRVIAMDKLGKSLQCVLRESNAHLSLKSIVQLGIQLVIKWFLKHYQIRSVEKLHQIGFCHNDIKPDNVMLKSSDFEDAGSSIITLIDFSAS